MSIVFKRLLKLDLPERQSTFLWGARKTGKSFFLKKKFPNSICYDLLNTELYWKLLKEPYVIREEILSLSPGKLARPIILDEVQRVPALLDEVHWLIENSSAYFILCGSSARKLKRGAANMLGGRAWRYEFYPLVYPEIPEFDLLRALNQGLVPSHYIASNWRKTIKAYIFDYLEQEIKEESLTRNLIAFARFLDVMAFSNGELINYSNIARDCGVDSKTVKEYYQILEDTLLGYHLYPYKDKRKREDVVGTPKFYCFDVGVVNGLTKRNFTVLKGKEVGAVFEHYILMELLAHRGINDLDHPIKFWRSKTGQEVDFILGDAHTAIEVKISETVHRSDLHGLIAFQKKYHPKFCFVVCQVPRRRRLEIDANHSIDLLPWETFLKMLWQGEIM